jgi:hypothetical protein
MDKGRRRGNSTKKRSLFRELMSRVQAMRNHQEGRITVPAVDPEFVRETCFTAD